MKTALVVLVLTVIAAAQTPLGTVAGLTLDPSGAVVVNVTVTLTNQATGVIRRAATNTEGAYSFPDLTPGLYRLGARAEGFRPVETEAFPVDAYKAVRQDIVFQLAASRSQDICVIATPVIQLDTPTVAIGLGARQIVELPTNLRSVAKNSGDSGLISEIMPETVPGVVQVANGAKWLTPGAVASGTKVKVDGIETTFGNFGSPDNVSQPSVEAVAEFSANVLTARAEFGGMGTVTSVTKSGGNALHGGIYWYMRNSATDARNAFATSRPFQNLHNYGGTLGGAIRKNKTFFFGDFDGLRGVAAYLFSPNVPTAAMRQGDFTGFAALKNPFSGVVPFNGNSIAPQYLSAQALQAQSLFFPQPNFGAPSLTAANYRASFSGPEVHRTEEIRLDHNFTYNHNAFLRYENRKDDYQIPGARSPLPPTTVGTSDNIRRVNFWTLGDVYAIRPTLLNEFRAGAVILVSASSSDFTGQGAMTKIGIQGLPDRGPVHSLPFFNISGFSNNNINLLSPVNDGHAQLADTLTWNVGRHMVKFGAEFIDWFVNRYMPNNSGTPIFGSYTFNGMYTGNAYADFLLGLPATATRQEPYAPQYNRARDWAAFAQDDFKVTPRLTLMYGLRYEYNGPAYARDGDMYSFDPASGKIVVPNQQSMRYVSALFPASIPLELASQMGVGQSLRHADGNNFAPRFGFSYQLGSDFKTVIRGGWGIYYGHYSANVPGGLAAGPFAATTVNTNTQPLVSFTLANPFATPGAPGTLSLRAVAPGLRNGYAQQYSLSLERELLSETRLRISYIGSKGTQLAYRRDINQPLAGTQKFSAALRPYPQFNAINYADNGGNSLYSGLQTQVERRFTRGLLFSSTWVWAKEIADIDDTDDFELNTTIEDTYSRARDRGNVYAVPRHQWLNQALWDLPLGKGLLRGGWQLNMLLNRSTGNWFTPMIGGVDPTNTNQTTLRPDIAVSPIPMPRTAAQWFDPTAFSTPSAGHWGNAGRGIIQGPGYILFNLGLQKTVAVEKFGALQLVASFQNVLNHANLGEPSAGGSPLPGQVVVNNANGGKITSTAIFPPAGSPRTGQIGVRLTF